MNNKKQKLLIEYLVSSTDTFAICQGLVQPEYFDPELRTTVGFIKQYYAEYNTTPNTVQIEAETGLELDVQEVFGTDELEYTTKEIETFCRRRAIEKAVLASPKLIEEGDYGTLEKNITDAIMLSLNRDLGVRYFENVEERLRRMLEDTPVLSTGWKDLDEHLFGGISRKEMTLVSANSGGGKSIFLANLSYNFIQLKRNVLYISLELSEDVVAQRFDTMVTGIGRKDWKSYVSEISTKVEAVKEDCGTLDIIQMKSGTTANTIKAYLKEFYLHYKFMPDLIVLDYLDKMHPNEKVDMSDVWTKDKLVAEQLRDIGVEYNLVIATASQLNRDAVKATSHDHSHIAGGISKINESDVYASIVMSDTMKAQGQMALTLQKTRNSDGVGKTIYFKWVGSSLRILDQEDTSFSVNNFIPKTKAKPSADDLKDGSATSLLSLMANLNKD